MRNKRGCLFAAGVLVILTGFTIFLCWPWQYYTSGKKGRAPILYTPLVIVTNPAPGLFNASESYVSIAGTPSIGR
jgi:hypothetical protein